MVAMFFSVFWTILFVYMLMKYGETLIKISIAVCQVFLVSMCVASYILKNLDTADSTDPATSAQDKTSDGSMSWWWFFSFIFFFVASIVYFCVMWGARKQVGYANDIIEAVSDMLWENKRLWWIPVFYFSLMVMLFMVYVIALISCISLNPIIPGKIDVDPQDKDVDWNAKYVYMLIVLTIGFFWCRAFLEYTSKFIISSATATYYWSCDCEDEDDGEAEVGFSIRIAHVNHTGSIALGAFVIGFVQTIDFLFMYFARKAENLTPKNACIKLTVCCASCIIKILEGFVDHISVGAFSYMV